MHLKIYILMMAKVEFSVALVFKVTSFKKIIICGFCAKALFIIIINV